MKVLIVEDDSVKLQKINDYICEILRDSSLVLANSVQSALRNIRSQNFDLIVLDMSLPTFDIGPNESGGRPQGFGGREILRQMDRSGIRSHVVVVTQFEAFGTKRGTVDIDRLKEMLAEEYPNNFKEIIYYSAINDSWKLKLSEHIQILESGRAE